MLAVPQNMGFLACALPIESYSLCAHLCYVAPPLYLIEKAGQLVCTGHIST